MMRVKMIQGESLITLVTLVAGRCWSGFHFASCHCHNYKAKYTIPLECMKRRKRMPLAKTSVHAMDILVHITEIFSVHWVADDTYAMILISPLPQRHSRQSSLFAAKIREIRSRYATGLDEPSK